SFSDSNLTEKTPGSFSDSNLTENEPGVIFLYDAYPGGIGFSAPLFAMHADLLARTYALIAGCGCENGCPTCVGPVGETGPLAKTVALALLGMLLDAAGARHLVTGDTAPHADSGGAIIHTDRPERRGLSPGDVQDDVPF